MKHRTGQLNETSELKKVRKKIAQIKTVINEIKLKDENDTRFDGVADHNMGSYYEAAEKYYASKKVAL